MKKFFIIVFIAYMAYLGYQQFGPKKIIMYSLSYCPHCQKLSAQLHRVGIEFEEYYIDKDWGKKDELTEKLLKHNVPSGGVLMPVVDMGDVILPSRPSLSEIRSHLEKKK